MSSSSSTPSSIKQDLLDAYSTYPSLVKYEDSISKNPYQVSEWIVYLEEIDALLNEQIENDKQNSSRQRQGRGGQQQASDSTVAMSAGTSLLIRVRDICGKRAVKLLPKSYKLWKNHWEFIIQQYKRCLPMLSIGEDDGSNIIIPSCIVSVGSIVQLFERALVTLHGFPRVWIEYLNFVHEFSGASSSTSITRTTPNNYSHPTRLRRLANRALESLPVTQHDKIWPVLLQYYQTPSSLKTDEDDEDVEDEEGNTVNDTIPAETKVCLLRRYLQYNPLATKEVADFLSGKLHRYGEAALLYKKLLDTPESITLNQRQELWMSLADICTKHPTVIEEPKAEVSGDGSNAKSAAGGIGLDWDSIVRGVLSNLKKYLPDAMEGFIWNQLADYWIRRGEFQLARSVYEEALESVSTVRDFTILLDAYLQFEESLLEVTMQNQPDDDEAMDEEDGDKVMEDGGDDDDWDILLPKKDGEESSLELSSGAATAPASSSMADLELALARAEDLTSRRPLLLNRVLLKQSPHDVSEWLKRAKLYQERNNPDLAATALEEALLTVNARQAVLGSPSQLVIQLSKIYEEDCKDIDKARDVFDRVCEQHVYEFKTTDDLAECYAAWVELELRHESWDTALDIIRRSIIAPPPYQSKGVSKIVRGLSKSSRLWDLLFDLEESLGTVQTTKDAYNRAIETKVATPVHVLNFASFLKEQKYFEESFTAYERGVEMFEFPGVKAIWKAYLDAFLKRYNGTKIERTRDLFQRCIEACPPEDCTEFFIMNGEFEEEYGLTKRALRVYRDLCEKVPASEKYTAYQLFIAKTTKYMGLTATRDIYQAAIDGLKDDTSAAQMCLDFAKMESSLQEIDRARAILTYGSQMADPRRNESYWKTWNDFEVTHGNEETFREMLRVKRSVEASFSTVNYNAAEMSGTSENVGTLTNEQAMRMIAEREGVEVDPSAPSQQSSTLTGFVSASKKRPAPTSAQLDDVEERVSKLRKAAASAAAASEAQGDDDDDEIDIDDLDDEDEDDEGEDTNAAAANDPSIRNVSTKAVPAAVFGGLANAAQKDKTDEGAPVGALQRLRAAAARK